MKLLIKQRAFSLTDTYYVYDETGDIRYEVKDEFLSLGHQIHVYDRRTGREVGSIHQKFFTFTPEFEIIVNGQPRGRIRKEFTFFVPRYFVDYKGWEVDGDLLGWNYQVSYGGQEVLSIYKEAFNWTDTYAMHYRDPVNELPGLLLVIAIDAVNCSKNK